jgi:hypothetical protein
MRISIFCKLYQMSLCLSKGEQIGENHVIIVIHGRGGDDKCVHILNRLKSNIVVKHIP